MLPLQWFKHNWVLPADSLSSTVNLSNLGLNYILKDQFMAHLNLNFFSLLVWEVEKFSKLLDFSRQSFWVPTTLCYLQIWTFYPITPFQLVRIKTFLHKLGSFFQDNVFEYQLPYVILKIECFVSYLHSKWSDLKNSFTNRGCFFQDDHFE